MKRIIVIVAICTIFIRPAILFCIEITAKVELKEKRLKQFQPIAKAEVAFPEKGYVYVTDRTGLKVQSVRVIPKEKYKRNLVYFRTNLENTYYVRWISEEKRSETSIIEIPEGKVILDDYLNPSARTSGFWFWVTNPCLSGSFSHTGRSQQKINSHYTSIIPGQKTQVKDVLYQYVFQDPDNPAAEIMIEIQTQRRKSYYFSWGSNIINWKGISKIAMGQLPEKGRWAVLAIPVEKMGKDVEITGIGFYDAGGRVFWDYTTIGNPALETRIVEWKKKDGKINAFFEKEIYGPFSFSGNEFYAGVFDANCSTGADTCIWDIDGEKYSGKYVSAIFKRKSSAYISLLCRNNKSKEEDVFSETIIFQKGTPEEVKLFLRILPHKNLLNAGETFYLPVQAGSLMSDIIPVEVCAKDRKWLFKLLPGKENAHNLNLMFNVSKPESHSIEMSIGNLTVTRKILRFTEIEDLNEKNLEGPYLVDKDGARMVAIIPDYRFSNTSSETEIKKITFVGEIPGGFFEELKKQYPFKLEVDQLSYPETNNYHAISDFLWLKKEIGGRDTDTLVLFPSLDALLRRTPVDEYTAAIDACLWFLSKRAKKIICATPFPSAPLPEIFRPYAEAIVSLCKKRNVVCFNLYQVYTGIPGWESFFQSEKGVYKNLPSDPGIEILVKSFLDILNASVRLK